jgi:transcription attenuation protein (tryptophan RNA-binding attenuator protein)
MGTQMRRDMVTYRNEGGRESSSVGNRDLREKNTEGPSSVLSDFIVVHALEDGVTVIGLTRGQETRFSHTEKLDAGEVWISQFTEHTSAVKIRGRAKIYSKHGVIESGGRESCEK